MGKFFKYYWKNLKKKIILLPTITMSFSVHSWALIYLSFFYFYLLREITYFQILTIQAWRCTSNEGEILKNSKNYSLMITLFMYCIFTARSPMCKVSWDEIFFSLSPLLKTTLHGLQSFPLSVHSFSHGIYWVQQIIIYASYKSIRGSFNFSKERKIL